MSAAKPDDLRLVRSTPFPKHKTTGCRSKGIPDKMALEGNQGGDHIASKMQGTPVGLGKLRATGRYLILHWGYVPVGCRTAQAAY